MFSTGFLLVTSPVSQIASKFGGYLRYVNQLINKTVYVRIDPNLAHKAQNAERGELNRLLPKIYSTVNSVSPHLDIRLLWGNRGLKRDISLCPLQYEPQIIVTDFLDKSKIVPYLENQFRFNAANMQLQVIDENIDLQNSTFSNIPEEKSTFRTYKSVCLGGTFDNLHNGHKFLLNTAQLCCTDSVTVGVTDINMIKNKVLWELIKPVEQRINTLRQYLKESDPTLNYNIVPISDPFGPSTEDPLLESIIVSKETLKGGNKVNEVRSSKNMKPLDVIVIDLVNEENKEASHEEDKVSSSSLRMRKLGTIIRQPKEKNLPKQPYLIGLTGGIASGKSSVASKLAGLGAGTINCDLLGHKAYENNTGHCFKEIINYFGTEILTQDKKIDRKKLGAIVFNDKEKLNKLNSFVWPEVKKLVDCEIKKLSVNHKVIVLELALLLEANWDENVHQVWVCIIPPQEAILRLKNRDGLDEKDALSRINSQMTNTERVQRANLVFCTLWESSFTMMQAQKAWAELQKLL